MLERNAILQRKERNKKNLLNVDIWSDDKCIFRFESCHSTLDITSFFSRVSMTCTLSASRRRSIHNRARDAMMGHRLFANYYFYLPIDFSLYCWKMKNAILRCRCPILLSILQFSISLLALSISRYLSGAHCEIKGKQNRFLAAASVMINQMRKSTTRKGRIGRQKKKCVVFVVAMD